MHKFNNFLSSYRCKIKEKEKIFLSCVGNTHDLLHQLACIAYNSVSYINHVVYYISNTYLLQLKVCTFWLPASPYKNITLLSTIFPTLYISSPWLTHEAFFFFFVTWSWYLLFSLKYFTHLPPPPLTTTCLFSVPMTFLVFFVCLFFYLFICFCSLVLFFGFHIEVKLSFSSWLISLSIILSRSTHVAMPRFHPL